MDKIIIRFAPSPTGKLHIGSARTALFNYLFAKKFGGKFIVRIEDTDIQRSKPEFEEDILNGLEWLGISYDEKFRQSERSDIYEKYIQKLLEKNLAYKCFCSQEELENDKEKQRLKGLVPIYSGKCSKLKKEKDSSNFVIRLRVNNSEDEEEIIFNDLIRGEIKIKKKLIGDIIIVKAVNNRFFPLYNFAVVVDDYETEISHIIRGEDHIPNTPKQILIQKALGFPIPRYAHLPLILGTDRSKMSKRSGATSVTSYKEAGYLPEALINFLAFLGWNPKNERDFFTMDELIKEFSIEKMQKSGAIFNVEKLDYINGYYIRKKKVEELTDLCLPYLINSGLIVPTSTQKYRKRSGEIIDLKYLEKIIGIHQERLKKLSEIGELTDYFFDDNLSYKKEMFIWKEMTHDEVIKSLKFTKKLICDRIKKEDFNQNSFKEVIEEIVLSFNKSLNLPPELMKNKGFVLWPFRVALTAKQASSGPFEIAEIFGKEETIKRIDQAISFLQKNL